MSQFIQKLVKSIRLRRASVGNHGILITKNGMPLLQDPSFTEMYFTREQLIPFGIKIKSGDSASISSFDGAPISLEFHVEFEDGSSDTTKITTPSDYQVPFCSNYLPIIGISYPITIWVYGGGLSFANSGPHPAISTRLDYALGENYPFIGKSGIYTESDWSWSAWNEIVHSISISRGNQIPSYVSVETVAIDSNGIVWGAGCARTSLGNPPCYHWDRLPLTTMPYDYNLILKCGWIPWAYYPMLAGWVLTTGSNILDGGDPFAGFSVRAISDKFYYSNK